MCIHCKLDGKLTPKAAQSSAPLNHKAHAMKCQIIKNFLVTLKSFV